MLIPLLKLPRLQQEGRALVGHDLNTDEGPASASWPLPKVRYTPSGNLLTS